MPDFDFDELDKAVAGALQSDNPDDASTPASNPAPTPEPIAPKQEEKSTDDTRSATPAARRSAGRFMDVVHPSSDMRGRTSSGQLLNHKEAPASFTPPTSVAKDEEVAVVTQATPEDELKNSSQPLESPFLPDAKVEKRPLGAFVARETSMLSTDDDELKLEAPDEPRLEAHTMPDPIDFAAQSAALDTETEDTGALGSVEAESKTEETVSFEVTNENIDAEPIEAEVASVEQSSLEPTSDTNEEQPREDTIEHEPETEPSPVETVVGPTSISQQYEEKPSTEQSSGAIYDTETYHQPLSHSDKKHSSVWTILWILLLVILGAGAGVAFYLFVLPML